MSYSPKSLYRKMLKLYGRQGWWPVYCEYKDGYHPNIFGIPATKKGAFEVCMGAILTQNTSWVQVEKALKNLFAAKIISAEKILKTDSEIIANLITPAGYRNQKTAYLKNMAEWFAKVDSGKFSLQRDNLLKVKGVGRETADSILLYAFHQPSFVIDTYTRRTLCALNLFSEKDDYETLRSWFMNGLEPSAHVYQEFHALFVWHAKQCRASSVYTFPE